MWGIIAVLVAGAGTAYYFKAKSDTKTAAQGSLVSVSTAVLGLGDVHATVRVNGTISAEKFAPIMAPRIVGSRSGMNRGGDGGGRGASGGGGGGGAAGGGAMGGGGPMNDFSLVLMALAKPGIRVKTGDVIAEFDPQNQIQRLDDYKDTLVQQENTVKKMLANLAAVKESHDQQVRVAKATRDKALLDLKTAEVRSAIDAEKFKLTVEESEANYQQLLVQSSLVDESQRSQVRANELTRDQSKLEMARAETNVEKMKVKSPMGGIIVLQSVTRNGEFGQIREGDQVAAGQPFVIVVDPTSMVLNATVNQVDAERLRLGMKATIRMDAYPDIQVQATVTGIGAMAKASSFRAQYVGEIPVRLKLEGTDPRIIPDLTGSAEIVLSTEQSTLVAPRSAVFHESDGTHYVYVHGGEQGWLKKKVEIGLPSFVHVAIRSGVQKGDVVALQRPM
ncbi:MAG: HlyD family efflux transporter periplasmic adaptor subunit [Candidatus Solibacter sp.]